MILKLCRGLSYGIMGIYCLILGMIILPELGGFQIEIITSGSMEPSVHTGAVVYVRPVKTFEEVKEGDIITYYLDTNVTKVTHRVVQKNSELETFTTKGDANDVPDAREVYPDQIEGIVSASIPYLGYVARMFMDLHGKVILICIFLAGLEICQFWTLLIESEQKRKEKENDKQKEKNNWNDPDLYIDGDGDCGSNKCLSEKRNGCDS